MGAVQNPMQVNVTVPDGVEGGSMIQVQTPKGIVSAVVPVGLQPGQQFYITV